MFRFARIRPVLLAAAVAAVTTFAGCNMSSHQTMKQQQMTRWNLTRIGIMLQLAEQQYKVGDYDKCNDTLKDAFATKAQFAPIYILAAKVQIEQGNLETAADDLNHALRINANEPEPYYLLGVLYQRWQKPDVACDYYKQAWAKKPEEERYMLATVEMEISLNRLDEAQKTLESKLVYFEQSAAVRVGLARIATLRNDFATAAKQYREATCLMPDDKNLERSYAEALYYANNYADAVPLFETLHKDSTITDQTNIEMMLGQCYLGLHRNQDARDCFQDIIRNQPENMLAYVNLGKACIETGDLGIAYAASRQILRTEPDNVEGMILLALVQQKEKKWSDSEATLAQASLLAPKDSTVLCMQGVSARELGQTQRAADFFEKAVAADPKDTWAPQLLKSVQPSTASIPATSPTPAAVVAPTDTDSKTEQPPAAANTPVIAESPNP